MSPKNINTLPEIDDIVGSDYLLAWDTSASTSKKVLVSDISSLTPAPTATPDTTTLPLVSVTTHAELAAALTAGLKYIYVTGTLTSTGGLLIDKEVFLYGAPNAKIVFSGDYLFDVRASITVQNLHFQGTSRDTGRAFNIGGPRFNGRADFKWCKFSLMGNAICVSGGWTSNLSPYITVDACEFSEICSSTYYTSQPGSWKYGAISFDFNLRNVKIINSDFNNCYANGIYIGHNTFGYSGFKGSIGGTTLTVTEIDEGSIPFGANQILTAHTKDIIAGTQIVAQLTGTAGGLGTYSVSQSQTVSLQPMRTNQRVNAGAVPTTNEVGTIIIDNNTFVDISRNAIETFEADNAIITNNTIIGGDLSYNNGSGSMGISFAGDDGIISNNYIKDFWGYGIELSGKNLVADGNTIDNCVHDRANPLVGMSIDYCNDTLVTGNKFKNIMYAVHPKRAINITNNSKRIRISNNVFENVTIGCNIDSNNIDYITFVGNEVWMKINQGWNPIAAFSCNLGTNHIIWDNIVHDCAPLTPEYMFRFAAGAGGYYNKASIEKVIAPTEGLLFGGTESDNFVLS